MRKPLLAVRLFRTFSAMSTLGALRFEGLETLLLWHLDSGTRIACALCSLAGQPKFWSLWGSDCALGTGAPRFSDLWGRESSPQGKKKSLKSKMKFRSYSSCQVSRVVSWDTWLYLDSPRMHRRFWWLTGLSLIVSMEKGVCLCSSLSREKSFTFFVTLLTEFHSQNLLILFWSWQDSVLWWERIL